MYNFINENFEHIIFLIIYIIILSIVFFINLIVSFYYYKYGDLLNKNCKDEKTEFEDPIFQFFVYDWKESSLILYMLVLVLTFCLILWKIKPNNISFSTLFSLVTYIRYIFIILILFVIISFGLIIGYFYDYNNLETDKKPKVQESIIAFITITLIIFIFLSFKLILSSQYKLLEFIVACSFSIILLIYIIILPTYTSENLSDFIWGFPKFDGNSMENLKNMFMKSGSVFTIYLVVFIVFFIISLIKKNTPYLSKDIIIILVLLAIFKVIYNSLIKNNVDNKTELENKLKDLNKEFSNFVLYSNSISDETYIRTLNESDFDDFQFFYDGTNTIGEKYKDYKSKDLQEYYKRKDCDTPETYTKKNNLQNFINYIIYKKDESSFDNKDKFIINVCKFMYNEDSSFNDYIELNTNDRINNAITKFIKFIEYIKKPTKYIYDNYKNIDIKNDGTNTNYTYKMIEKDIIKNYNELNPKNRKDEIVLEGDSYIIKDVNDIKKYSCLYFSFYNNNIDKSIDKYNNYELSLRSKENLKKKFNEYRNEIDNTNLDIEYIIMVLLCIIIMYIIVSKVPKLDWWSPIYTIILVSIIMIIIFLGINIKIIVDNVK
jgi:hypothetical protein